MGQRLDVGTVGGRGSGKVERQGHMGCFPGIGTGTEGWKGRPLMGRGCGGNVQSWKFRGGLGLNPEDPEGSGSEVEEGVGWV